MATGNDRTGKNFPNHYIRGETLGSVGRQFRDDLQVVELRLQRGHLLLAGSGEASVELQEVRQELPKFLPLHGLD